MTAATTSKDSGLVRALRSRWFGLLAAVVIAVVLTTVTEPCADPTPAPSAVGPTAPGVDQTVDLQGVWSIRWRRTEGEPRVLRGVMGLQERDGVWSGSAFLDEYDETPLAVTGLEVSGEHVRFTLASEVPLSFSGLRYGDTLDGEVRWTNAAGTPQRDPFSASHRDVRRFDARSPEARFPVATDPAATGIDPLALDQLILLADDADSDALIVISDGQVVCERYFGRTPAPMSLQSLTKAVSSLAIGMLVDEGAIESIETPLSEWYPEFAADGRSAITLRHLLTHTTGLADGDVSTLNRSPDRLGYARAAGLVAEPGTEFEYNNRAMLLLTGIIEAETGKSTAAFLDERLFGPLGIVDKTWEPDEAGHTPTFAGLNLLPMDLAAIGQLLVDDGRQGDQQLVPAEWIAALSTPATPAEPEMGLAWFLRFDSDAEGPGAPIGISHFGTQGQYLYVYPEASLVAVRLISLRSSDEADHTSALRGLGLLTDAMAQGKR